MFLACPNGVYMDYRANAVCTRTPLSAACLTTHCDKRSFAHKSWRVLRQAALRRTLRGWRPWAGIIPIHPAMIPRLARAGLRSSHLHVVRNPASPFSRTRIPAERNRRIAYVGRLEPDKGALDLARSAQRVGLAVTFVGDGSLRATLERDFPDMRVTGWAEPGAIGPLLQDARALVMPSRHPEPFALVLPEALLSGLPVAVADTALMADEVTALGLGLAFDVFDPAAFDAVLKRLRDMPDAQIRSISDAGHAAQQTLANSPEGWTDALIAL